MILNPSNITNYYFDLIADIGDESGDRSNYHGHLELPTVHGEAAVSSGSSRT